MSEIPGSLQYLALEENGPCPPAGARGRGKKGKEKGATSGLLPSRPELEAWPKLLAVEPQKKVHTASKAAAAWP